MKVVKSVSSVHSISKCLQLRSPYGHFDSTYLSHFEFLFQREASLLPFLDEPSITMQASQQGSQAPQHLVSASLLRKIDKLREKNIGKHVPLPQVRTT